MSNNQYPGFDQDDDDDYGEEVEQIQQQQQQNNDQNEDNNNNIDGDENEEFRDKVIIKGQEIEPQYLGVKQVRYYIVQHLENGKLKPEVKRRYKDFEWLFEQLKFDYYGYILPPIPPKDFLSNFNRQQQQGGLEQNKNNNNNDNNQQNQNSNNDLQKQKNSKEDEYDINVFREREILFQQFLTLLLKNKKIKKSQDLRNFLEQTNRETFEKQMADSTYTQNYNQQDYKAYTVTKQFVNMGFQLFGGTKDQPKQIERFQVSEEDKVNFQEYLESYNRQKNKLQNIFNCFHGLFEYKKCQAEASRDSVDIFRNLEEINKKYNLENESDENNNNNENDNNLQDQNLNIDVNLVQITEKSKDIEKKNHKMLLEQIEIPLKGFVSYYEQCEILLNERLRLISDIKYKEDSYISNPDEEVLNKLSKQIIAVQTFNSNFKDNKQFFDDLISQKIVLIVNKYQSIQQDFTKDMLKIWGN